MSANKRFIDIHIFDALTEAKIQYSTSYTIQYPRDEQISVAELYPNESEYETGFWGVVVYVYDGNTGHLLYDFSVHDKESSKFESNKLCVYVVDERNLEQLKKKGGDKQ